MASCANSKAVEAARRSVEILSQCSVSAAESVVLSSLGGDFQGGEREARAGLQINPSLVVGYLNLAERNGQGKMSEAVESYHQLEKVSGKGASIGRYGSGRFRCL